MRGGKKVLSWRLYNDLAGITGHAVMGKCNFTMSYSLGAEDGVVGGVVLRMTLWCKDCGKIVVRDGTMRVARMGILWTEVTGESADCDRMWGLSGDTGIELKIQNSGLSAGLLSLPTTMLRHLEEIS